MSKQARNIALAVLAEFGLTNPVKVRSTTFDCSRFGTNYIAVEIHGWEPNPLADQVENRIKQHCNEQCIGVLVSFKGSGFIDAKAH